MENSVSMGVAGRIGVLLFTALIPLVLSTGFEDLRVTPQVLCATIFAAFLLFVSRAEDWNKVFRTGGVPVMLGLAFFAGGIFSSWMSDSAGPFSLPEQRQLWVWAAFFFFAPIGGLLDKRKFEVGLVLTGVVGSLAITGKALYPGSLSLGNWAPPEALSWAGFSLMVLPMGCVLSLEAQTRRETLVWAGATLLLMAGLLATRVPGAWLGFLAEGAVLILFNRKNLARTKSLMMGLILFLLALLFVPSLKQKTILAFYPSSLEQKESRFLRKTALRIWEENRLWGAGPGGFGAKFMKIQSDLERRDSIPAVGPPRLDPGQYWELLAERGVAGAVLGFALLGSLLRQRKGRGETSVEPAEIAVLAGMGIYCFFHSALSDIPTACLMAVCFNPGWGISTGTPVETGRHWNEGRFFLGVALVALGGMGVMIAAQNARLHEGIRLNQTEQYERAFQALDFDPVYRLLNYADPRVLRQRAVALTALGKYGEAIQVLREAVRIDPNDADSYSQLCLLYGTGKEWDEAQEAGEKALALSPYHEGALSHLALLSFLRGQKKKGLQCLSALEACQTARGEKQKAFETRQKLSALGRSRH